FSKCDAAGAEDALQTLMAIVDVDAGAFVERPVRDEAVGIAGQEPGPSVERREERARRDRNQRGGHEEKSRAPHDRIILSCMGGWCESTKQAYFKPNPSLDERAARVA